MHQGHDSEDLPSGHHRHINRTFQKKFKIIAEFRQKAKHMMTRREILAIVLFVMLAMHQGHDNQARDPLPGAAHVIMETARKLATSTWDTVIKDTTKKIIRDSGSVG